MKPAVATSREKVEPIRKDQVFDILEELVQFMEAGCVELQVTGGSDQSTRVKEILKGALESNNYRALIGPVREIQRLGLSVSATKGFPGGFSKAEIERRFKRGLFSPALLEALTSH